MFVKMVTPMFVMMTLSLAFGPPAATAATPVFVAYQGPFPPGFACNEDIQGNPTLNGFWLFTVTFVGTCQGVTAGGDVCEISGSVETGFSGTCVSGNSLSIDGIGPTPAGVTFSATCWTYIVRTCGGLTYVKSV